MKSCSEKFCKSVKIWQNYCHESVAPFFDRPCIYVRHRPVSLVSSPPVEEQGFVTDEHVCVSVTYLSTRQEWAMRKSIVKMSQQGAARIRRRGVYSNWPTRDSIVPEPESDLCDCLVLYVERTDLDHLRPFRRPAIPIQIDQYRRWPRLPSHPSPVPITAAAAAAAAGWLAGGLLLLGDRRVKLSKQKQCRSHTHTHTADGAICISTAPHTL